MHRRRKMLPGDGLLSLNDDQHRDDRLDDRSSRLQSGTLFLFSSSFSKTFVSWLLLLLVLATVVYHVPPPRWWSCDVVERYSQSAAAAAPHQNRDASPRKNATVAEDDGQHLITTTRRNQLDFKSCVQRRRRQPSLFSRHQPLLLSPKVDKAGFGHRLTQLLAVVRLALMHGHCICLNPSNLVSPVIYDLLLSSVFAMCPVNATVVRYTVKNGQDLAKQLKQYREKNHTDTADADNDVVFEIYPFNVWSGQFGDLVAFTDRWMRDNHVVRDVIYPKYLEKRQQQGRGNAFPASSRNNDTIVKAVAHLRVGDHILEKTASYWHNVLQSMRAIVDLEYGYENKQQRQIHLYFAYFQTVYRNPMAPTVEERLLQDYGAWPDQQSDPAHLPPSHAFLADVCNSYRNQSVHCFWKHGTSTQESLDLFVHADLMYISGSSYAQTLSLFHARPDDVIKLVAITKELNHHGNVKPGTIPFLTMQTTGYNSLGHYYVDVDGALYPQQGAFRNLA